MPKTSYLLDLFSREEFEDIVKNSYSYADLTRKLGYKANSGDLNIILRKRIEKFNIDTSHFHSNCSNIRITRTFENIFCENSTANQATLRRWITNCNLLIYKCSICGMEPIWQGKPLTLILDHINGINNDDRIENLRFVCPNCNQQLETTNRRKSSFEDSVKYYCCDCGKEIGRTSKRCARCESKHRENMNLLKIPKDELEKYLYELQNFEAIGRIYNVSGNSIKKWCKKCGLPYKTSMLKGEGYGESHYCKLCGKLLNGETRTGLCQDCYIKTTSKIPNKEEFYQKLEELKTISALSRYYNVTRHTIRKWKNKIDNM